MQVWRIRGARFRRASCRCLAGLAVLACTVTLTGCAASTKPKTASIENCGTGKTAANVPVEVEIYRGTVPCSVALTVTKNYAEAIVDGLAPGNGGGGPVPVQGWTCQGFPTPQLLKTGDAAKCARHGIEILEILKTPG